MTILDLKDAGLPECPPCAWADSVRADGWEMSYNVAPGPREVFHAYNVKERRFALVFNITACPISYEVLPGTARELAAWIEANRPEMVEWDGAKEGSPTFNPYREMTRYAEDPSEEADWWNLCDSVDRCDIGLTIDVGDA